MPLTGLFFILAVMNWMKCMLFVRIRGNDGTYEPKFDRVSNLSEEMCSTTSSHFLYSSAAFLVDAASAIVLRDDSPTGYKPLTHSVSQTISSTL